MSRTTFSAGSFGLTDFCLIFVPFGHYDEPEILRYAKPSICPIGADVKQIIRSGHNIDPEAIETPMHAHPAVAHCAAVGKPDPYAGEMPVVYVKLVEGAQATEAELMEHARANISERAAVPKQIILVPELPLTAVGKIAKNHLRDEAARAAVAEAVAQVRELSTAHVALRRDPARGTKVVVMLAADDPAARLAAESLLAGYAMDTAIEVAEPQA